MDPFSRKPTFRRAHLDWIGSRRPEESVLNSQSTPGDAAPRDGFWRRNPFLRHVASLMTGTAAAQVISLIAGPILTRLYTPTELGVLSVFSAVVAVIAVIATLRYDMAIMLPKEDRSAVVLRRSVTWIGAIVGLLATFVLLLISRPLADMMGTPEAAPWFLLAGLSAFTLAEIAALSYWLNRRSRYTDMAANRVVQSAGTAVAQIGLAFIKPLGAGGLVIGSIIGQIVSIVSLRLRTKELTQTPRTQKGEYRSTLGRYRRMPLLNAPTALIDTLRMSGIILVIGMLWGGAEVGQFGQAWKYIEAPAVLISSALAQVFFQRLSTTPRGRLQSAAWRSVLLAAGVGIVPFILVWVLSPWAFPFVLGEPYAPAGLFAQALVPWLFMNLVTSPISTIFVVTEQQHISLVFTIIYTIVPLTLLFVFASDIMFAVLIMSLAMAALLIANVVLAMIVARRWDRGVDATMRTEEV